MRLARYVERFRNSEPKAARNESACAETGIVVVGMYVLHSTYVSSPVKNLSKV